MKKKNIIVSKKVPVFFLSFFLFFLLFMVGDIVVASSGIEPEKEKEYFKLDQEKNRREFLRKSANCIENLNKILSEAREDMIFLNKVIALLNEPEKELSAEERLLQQEELKNLENVKERIAETIKEGEEKLEEIKKEREMISKGFFDNSGKGGPLLKKNGIVRPSVAKIYRESERSDEGVSHKQPIQKVDVKVERPISGKDKIGEKKYSYRKFVILFFLSFLGLGLLLFFFFRRKGRIGGKTKIGTREQNSLERRCCINT